jgi:hypothetical protein
MADVRCPMCGKTNPADHKQCQYCHARLRPIWDTGSTISQPGPSEDQSDELPDWLKSLRGPQEEQPVGSRPEPVEYSNQPDWLSDLRQQPLETDNLQPEEISNNITESSDDETSDWLQNFLAEDDLGEAQGEAVSVAPSDDSIQEEASWLSRISSTPVEEDRPSEPVESLDWLSEPEPKSLGEMPSGDQGRYPTADSQAPESMEPLPGWLAQPEAVEPASAPQEPVQSGAKDETSLAPQPSDEWDAEEELPAWLFVATEDTKATTDTGEVDLIASTELQSDAGPVEEWAAPPGPSVDELQPEEGLGESPPDQVGSDEGAPGLPTAEMAILESAEPPLEPPVAEQVAIPAEERAAEGESLEALPGAELPSEASSEATETPEEGAAPLLEVAGAAAVVQSLDLGEDLPEEDLGWLDELETEYSDRAPNALDEPASGGGAAEGLDTMSTLPMWLTSSPEEEAQVLEETPEDEGELKPADMPSWLQAMRPVGVAAAAASVLSEPESGQIEGAGPLAGLRDALPAEPDVSKVQKPPVYSIKLQVTDTQQIQSRLLSGLIDSEGQSQALPERSASGSQKVVRLLMAVFLIVPLLFVLISGIPRLSLPVLPLEVDAVARLIDALPPGAPVLVAVDYQPGFSGEMDTITAPVLQHLFERGAFPVAVSTVATGPVQAEHLLAKMGVSNGASGPANVDYANLGYIPGGATGLLAFAQSPSDTLPTNLQGQRVWDTPALQPADTLDKFAMVVVATDNPDVARSWIEQVQPYLGATPMVMVLSAQAEPVVRPYYEANPSQVQGLVGGLAGGAAYLGRSAKSGDATRFWSPFGAGALIAVILMILAGLVNLISAQVNRRKEMVVGGKGT